MTQGASLRRRQRWAWVLTDWAREPFFSIVLSLVFPPFFVSMLVRDPVRGTALWGYMLAGSALMLVICAPLAGRLADVSAHRRLWISSFTLMAAGALALLGLVAVPGDSAAGFAKLVPVLILCALAQLSVELMRVFTDRLLPEIAPPEDIARFSGLGVGLGFAASFLFLMSLQWIEGAQVTKYAAGIVERAATAGTGVWLALFTLPLLFTLRERSVSALAPPERRGGPRQYVRAILRSLRDEPDVSRFLLARMIYWDGTMALFAFFSILASTTLGWGTAELATFGLLALLAGATSGLLAGRVDGWLGARNTVLMGLLGMLACTILLALAARPLSVPGTVRDFDSAEGRIFLAVGVLASIFLALIMASSRALLMRLAPAGRLGEYLGLYVVVGRASSFLAPLLVALGATLSGDQRTGVLGVSLCLLGGGMALLWRVRRC